MAASDSKKNIPIKKGLFKPPTNGDPGHIVGSRCNACGEYFHPPRVVCANCYSEDIHETALSRNGTISTYTVVRVGYPDRAVKAPFICAQVMLPEKVAPLSLVTDIDFDQVSIGMEVELYFWKTGEDDEGNHIMAYAFRPPS